MNNIYPTRWNGGGSETECGGGSTYDSSHNFRQLLLDAIFSFKIKSITDLGCGDTNVLQSINFDEIDYLGYDVVERKSSLPTEIKDVVSENYRKSDLIICRDLMIHLPNEMCLSILDKCRESSDLLLATTFDNCSNINRIQEPSFGFCPLNLTKDPFNLDLIKKEQEKDVGKFIGLFKL